MQLSSVVKALVSLYLLLADGFPVSEDGSPKIIGPRHVRVKTHPGKQVLLHCGAFANCDADLALIYWLVNGSFPEDLSTSDRIVESEESTLEEGKVLQRSLLLKNVTAEDFKSTFTCVVINANGMAQKNMTLAKTNCIVGKRKKH